MNRKGISYSISIVMVFAIVAGVAGMVLNVGMPMISDMRDTSSIKQSMNSLSKIDSTLLRVASEEKYSTRNVNLRFDRGSYECDESSNSLFYRIQAEDNIVSPHSSKMMGNLKITSTANVSTNLTSINGVPCYMMENEHLKVCIRKIGSEDNMTDIDTGELLVYFYNKNLDSELNPEIEIKINENESTSSGQGYTDLREEGSYIGVGRVTAHLSVSNVNYKVIFDLVSGADFLIVEPRRA